MTEQTVIEQTGTAKTFTLNLRDDGVGVITMDVAGESMNVLKAAFAEQIASMQRLEVLVEKMINDQLKEAGLLAHLRRCMKVEGIGFLTGARLIAAFQRGEFKNADAFIAFLGMDLRVSQSGQKDGRRSLTKRGDPEARRLLHNAAMSASRTATWKGFYEEQRAKGFSTTQALVILARKLARVVFALLKGQSEYQPKAG